MLHALPGDVGENARLMIEQAVRSVNGASRGGPYVALARYTLARVIVALEREPE